MLQCISASRGDVTSVGQKTKKVVCVGELILIRFAPSRRFCSEELHCGVNETREEEKQSLGASAPG